MYKWFLTAAAVCLLGVSAVAVAAYQGRYFFTKD